MSKFKRRTRNTGGDPEEAKSKPKRDLSGMLPRPGNNTTHGGYQLAEQWASGKLDLRSKAGRMLKEFESGIVNEIGVCSATQRALLNRASELLLIISAMSQHVAETAIMENGELVKCLRQSFLSYSNAFRRMLRGIHELRPDAPPGLGSDVTINIAIVDDHGEPMNILKQPAAIGMKKVGESDKSEEGKAEDSET